MNSILINYNQYLHVYSCWQFGVFGIYCLISYGFSWLLKINQSCNSLQFILLCNNWLFMSKDDKSEAIFLWIGYCINPSRQYFNYATFHLSESAVAVTSHHTIILSNLGCGKKLVQVVRKTQCPFDLLFCSKLLSVI